MSIKEFSIATFNLYNLNEPGKPMYNDTEGWSNSNYQKKIEWISEKLAILDADVVGFQELWNSQSLINVLEKKNLTESYDILTPKAAVGDKIHCAAIVKKELSLEDSEWIVNFPEEYILQSKGDDSQTPTIKVSIKGFSRPVLHFTIKPHEEGPRIHIYVCHFKSKSPTKIYANDWYKKNKEKYKSHSKNLGSALSTIRRTAESSALRFILTEQMKNTEIPVIVIGDINDSTYSNTANILTEQPNYLFGDSWGGGDNSLYSTQTLEEYRDTKSVIYTHIYKKIKESLDQIFVSREFYDHSRNRIWLFQELDVFNDHLNGEDHKNDGSNDHGILKARFRYKPI